MGKRELLALFCLSPWWLMIVVWLFLTMPCGCLQFVNVAFLDHTLTIYKYLKNTEKVNYTIYIWCIKILCQEIAYF